MCKPSALLLIARAIGIVLLTGLGAALLVRSAPGFGIDERALDPRLSAQTQQALDREHSGETNAFSFYLRFLRNMATGNMGRSIVFGEPVVDLIRERAPETVGFVLTGLGCGWVAALFCAAGAALTRRSGLSGAAIVVSGALLSVPAALLAIFSLLFRLPAFLVIAAAIFPRVFPYAYEQFRTGQEAAHVYMARARGISASRLFVFHVLTPALIPLIALAGVSVTLAFGVSIPVEALADLPGLGQLAWRAALGRDLPVLIPVTFLLTIFTVFSNLIADLVLLRFSRSAA
jgi:peptide/nickel transport system permease protein